MKLLLQRYSDNGQATAGLLFLVDEVTRALTFLGHTLEDEKRDVKVKGETRVKAGQYEVVQQTTVTPMTEKYRAKYDWFQFFLMLLNVPGFTGIYIHHGTKEQDTDGCLLTADNSLATFDEETFKPLTYLLSQSTVNMKRLYKLVTPELEAGKKVFIEIRDEITA